VHAAATDLHGTAVACAATGQNEGRATGIVAAPVVRVLAGGTPSSGVVHVEQLVNPSASFTELVEDSIVFHPVVTTAGPIGLEAVEGAKPTAGSALTTLAGTS
jgi:hypothetical protein